MVNRTKNGLKIYSTDTVTFLQAGLSHVTYTVTLKNLLIALLLMDNWTSLLQQKGWSLYSILLQCSKESGYTNALHYTKGNILPGLLQQCYGTHWLFQQTSDWAIAAEGKNGSYLMWFNADVTNTGSEYFDEIIRTLSYR